MFAFNKLQKIAMSDLHRTGNFFKDIYYFSLELNKLKKKTVPNILNVLYNRKRVVFVNDVDNNNYTYIYIVDNFMAYNVSQLCEKYKKIQLSLILAM
ncbi:hypothetical protein BLOT_015193 [Blomia tropicalis]|nr:hypothetical protein BLOT_015193 [Blomia tropicalis]